MPYRRLLTLLVVLAAVALPAVILNVACIGNSCEDPGAAAAEVPFCSLPAELRADLTEGFREQRSPDVLAVPVRPVLRGWGDAGRGVEPAWPWTDDPPDGRVPIVLSGAGVTPGTAVPAGTSLTAIAPTVLDLLGAEWAFPGVHPGEPIALGHGGETPRLVLIVALKGVGSEELRAGPGAWPFLRSLLRGGAGTLEGDAGSLPLDPAATLTTIGTGATPADHGITGTLLRNDDRGGLLTRAWSDRAPLSVIATFADDLEAEGPFAGRARVGLVADDGTDRGLIGADWYAVGDTDLVRIARAGAAAEAADRILAEGFGSDDVPDVLGVVLRDRVGRIDRELRTIVDRAHVASGNRVLVVVAGTGSASTPRRGAESVPVDDVVRVANDAIPGTDDAIAGAQPGGLFLDQDVLAETGAGSGSVVQALLAMRDGQGNPVFADAFGGFAVQFGRFC